MTYNNKLTSLIEEFEEKMPSEIRILSLSASDSSINLSITVDSKPAVADVIMQLRTFDSIALGSISTISDGKDETGNGSVSFTLTCTYVDTATEETEATQDGGTIADEAAAVGESTDEATAALENESME